MRAQVMLPIREKKVTIARGMVECDHGIVGMPLPVKIK